MKLKIFSILLPAVWRVFGVQLYNYSLTLTNKGLMSYCQPISSKYFPLAEILQHFVKRDNTQGVWWGGASTIVQQEGLCHI